MTWSGQGANGTKPSFISFMEKEKFTHERFSGGRTSSGNIQKSAGDKVAELFAVLNNSNNFTFATATTKNILFMVQEMLG